MSRLRVCAISAFILLSCAVSPSRAATTDAREIARMNNCVPKKIEVYKQSIGPGAQTIYRVECNMPKTSGDQATAAADALLIQCSGSLCEMMRSIGKDVK